MSEWEKAKDEAKREARIMQKEVRGYSYKDEEHAEKTDKEYRNLVSGFINDSRDHVFPMIEAAYLEKHFENASVLEEVMKWLDIFLLEIGLKLEWRDDADYRAFSRLIKADVTLLENSRKLAQITKKMKEDVLRNKAKKPLTKKAHQLRQYVSDLMLVFKKRRHSLGG
jgi:hypothetical protein